MTLLRGPLAGIPSIISVILLLHSSLAIATDLPDFVALVKANSGAVVNISTTQRTQAKRGEGTPPEMFPDLPEGSPFHEFFKRFFEGIPEIPRERQRTSLGSGFVISSDGYILTASHVVKDAGQINVKLSDQTEKAAKLVGLDERTDVALLKIEAEDLTIVKIGDSDTLEVGEWVLAIGSPFGLELTATQGIVSAVGRSLPSDTYVPFIQTDVAVNPGNSGGPLFNTDGKVIGINAQIYSQTGGYMGLSFAIPINVAMKIAEQLKVQGFVTRGWLGVLIQQVSQELALSFGLDRPTGALIAQVVPGSPAAKGGLQTGDIILEYNGKAIGKSAELPPLVGETPIGKRVPIKVLRGGDTRTVHVTIEALSEKDEQLAQEPQDTATLNMTVTGLSKTQRDELGLSDQGVLVEKLGPGPAASAGIRPGDILLMLNGQDVTSPAELATIVRKLPTSKPVPVLIQRGESRLFLALTVPGTD